MTHVTIGMSEHYRTFLIDLSERVAGTFGAAAVAVLSAEWIAAANDAHTIGAWSSLEKIGIAAATAGAAAVVTSLKSIIVSSWTGTASASKTVSETAVLAAAPIDAKHALVVPPIDPPAPSAI